MQYAWDPPRNFVSPLPTMGAMPDESRFLTPSYKTVGDDFSQIRTNTDIAPVHTACRHIKHRLSILLLAKAIDSEQTCPRTWQTPDTIVATIHRC
jgi:hypothetical protein